MCCPEAVMGPQQPVSAGGVGETAAEDAGVWETLNDAQNGYSAASKKPAQRVRRVFGVFISLY